MTCSKICSTEPPSLTENDGSWDAITMVPRPPQ